MCVVITRRANNKMRVRRLGWLPSLLCRFWGRFLHAAAGGSAELSLLPVARIFLHDQKV
jgi:hypothetical protein